MKKQIALGVSLIIAGIWAWALADHYLAPWLRAPGEFTSGLIGLVGIIIAAEVAVSGVTGE